MALMLSDVLVIFDHLKHTVTILANADLDAEPDLERAYAAAAARSRRCAHALAGPVPRASVRSSRASGRCRASSRTWRASEFEGDGRADRASTSTPGDAFQVVPSQRWSAQVPVEAFSIYRGLRAVNPSPYMYFLDFGDFQVAGASPEPLLTVSGRHVSTKPIAGTRPRGATPRRTGGSRRSCWPTRRSAPST